MPAPVEPVHLLALLTRVRARWVAAGELAPDRLYDVRAFKCAYAELGYLRRLAAAGRAGGTVVTSMRQLVAGLAALHPAWRISGGEGFEDRDRHHRAVRRRLDALQAMGLLRWRIGTDLDGEERRTELELRPAPEVSVEELQAAARRLERWQARYGRVTEYRLADRDPQRRRLTGGRSARLSASAAGVSRPACGGQPGPSGVVINQIRHPPPGLRLRRRTTPYTRNAPEHPKRLAKNRRDAHRRIRSSQPDSPRSKR